MAVSPLLVRPSAPDADGRVHAVTPESAGWTYVGFEVYDLAPGQRLARETGAQEVCVVLMSGTARVGAGGQDFGVIGARSSVFEGPGWSLYAPAFRERALDFRRMRAQLLAAGDAVLTLDGLPSAQIAGDYPEMRRQRAAGAPTCPRERYPQFAPGP